MHETLTFLFSIYSVPYYWNVAIYWVKSTFTWDKSKVFSENVVLKEKNMVKFVKNQSRTSKEGLKKCRNNSIDFSSIFS